MEEGISKRFSEIREKTGLNRKQFADSLGIPSVTVSDIELAKREPSKDVLLKLAEKYGVNLHWMLTGQGISHENLNINENSVELYLTNFSLFKFSHGKPTPISAQETDPDAMVLVPVFSQRVAAGPGQPPNQLADIEAYIPVVLEMLGGAHPKNCGIVRVVGDSMTDITLFNGDFCIFDRSQLEGDGVYVISMSSDVRVKRIEYRPFEQKVIIRSENAKRYPDPEIITYEQAKEMLLIHGKVICWMHRHPY
jgi:SOS-response transcriptional repressor LexA